MTILQILALFIAVTHLVWEFWANASIGAAARVATTITMTATAFTGITWSLL